MPIPRSNLLFLAVPALILISVSPTQSPADPTSEDLISQLLIDNASWLKPDVKRLSYTFQMKHSEKDDAKTVKVEFTAPNHAVVVQDEATFDGEVDNDYDSNNTAYPPKLLTLLQATTFFGPLQEMALHPGDFDLSVVGEDVLDGVQATVLQLLPTGRTSDKAMSRWEDKIRESATIPEHLYELRPVVMEIEGRTKAGLEVESIFEPGPEWDAIVGQLKADPTRLEWMHSVYTPVEVEGPEGKHLMVAVDTYRGVCFQPTALLEEGEKKLNPSLEEVLRQSVAPPPRYLPMRIGCGIWGCWYGYLGGGAEEEKIWVDVTGAVLKEEGWRNDQLVYRVEYKGALVTFDGRYAPGNVVVNLFKTIGCGKDWVFDLKFSYEGGKVWLLKELVEYQGEDVAVE